MRMRNRVLACAVLIAMTVFLWSQAAGAAESITPPQEVVEISQELGEQYGICPELIQAICWAESRYKPDAENGGCIGIMQVYEYWHRDRMERLGVTDLRDMRGNMAVATDYLAELFEESHDIGYVLMVYNGTTNARELADKGQLTEYARMVLDVSAELTVRNRQ